jgi:hypothetical protein
LNVEEEKHHFLMPFFAGSCPSFLQEKGRKKKNKDGD